MFISVANMLVARSVLNGTGPYASLAVAAGAGAISTRAAVTSAHFVG